MNFSSINSNSLDSEMFMFCVCVFDTFMIQNNCALTGLRYNNKRKAQKYINIKPKPNYQRR